MTSVHRMVPRRNRQHAWPNAEASSLRPNSGPQSFLPSFLPGDHLTTLMHCTAPGREQARCLAKMPRLLALRPSNRSLHPVHHHNNRNLAYTTCAISLSPMPNICWCAPIVLSVHYQHALFTPADTATILLPRAVLSPAAATTHHHSQRQSQPPPKPMRGSICP